MSTITSLTTIDSDTYREGVNILTYQQLLNSPVARMRPITNDVFVYNGRIVNDNFFDENLVDMNIGGSITTAPSSFMEVRTLGDSYSGEPGFTDMTDFNPVTYLEDEGTLMYPTVINAGGYADPIRSNGIIGMFETRLEIAKITSTPSYAKRGIRASPCWASEGSDKKSYLIEQKVSRLFSFEKNKAPAFYEVGGEDIFEVIETITYPDQISSPSLPFIDSCDVCVGGNVTDSEIASVLLSGFPGNLYIERDTISSTAGWTMLNKTNGTDSIAYSDRM